MFSFFKNSPNWNKEEFSKSFQDFNEMYKDRPIKDNVGGMKYPHMFALYCLLLKIKPDFIVESGTWQGQGTWIIEKVLPKAKILSIDINLNNRKYISKKVQYSNIDFSDQNFLNLPKNSLVLFECHKNAVERFKQAKYFGFKHMVYGDNYPVGKGDCYTLKHAIAKSGFRRSITFFDIVKSNIFLLKELFKKLFIKNYINKLDLFKLRLNDVSPNDHDFDYINQNIDTYYEFPPLFKTPKTRWGDSWDEYPTLTPILEEEEKNKYKQAYEEANTYTWFTYLRFK